MSPLGDRYMAVTGSPTVGRPATPVGPPVRVATFNLFWLGHPNGQRTDADHARVAQVLAELDADVLVCQEVDDLALLARLAPRPYTWITGVRQPYPLKVVVGLDPAVRLRRWHTWETLPGRRKPLVLDLDDVTLVAVHLHARDPALRDREAAIIEARVATLPGPVVVAGDFNGATMALPAAFPDTWTSWSERVCIDGFYTRGCVVEQPRAVVTGDDRLRGRTITRADGARRAVPDFYGVSDHRPVVGDLRLGSRRDNP